jgi:uncharacterized secreted protein with C-terminal beta-propeller domain
MALLGMQLLPGIADAAFKDVSASAQYKTAIEALQADGVLEGYADNTFKPNATINRAEFIKIVREARGKESAKDGEVECFPDVHKEWFAEYVCEARREGSIVGYPDGLFHPEREINFVEAAKILSITFGVNLQQETDAWYGKYALALESSAAIPTSVKQLDSSLTRGEMAEILWRLTEKKTDQASKSFLNLKHPELRVALGGNDVVTATSCADLRVFATEAQSNGGQGMGGIMFRDGPEKAVMAPQANSLEDSASGAGGDGDYSQTNVQVAGVDEADIVKTDGTYLYIVSRTKGTVRIVKAVPAATMQQVAEISLADASVTPNDIYVANGTLVVTGTDFNVGIAKTERDSMMMGKMIAPGYYGNTRTFVRMYDVSSPANPKILRTLRIEGNQVSSRLIGKTMYLVTQKGTYWGWDGPIPLDVEKSLLPQINDSAKGGVDRAAAPCNKVMILPRVPSPQYLSVSAIPLSGTAEIQNSVILGSAQNVYSSLENLYVSAPQWSYVWDSSHPESQEKTRIYRFALSANGAELKAQGDIPGHILNQFSMDEANDTFRVATTTSPMWSNEHSRSTNALYILGMDMKQVGAVTDIAPGESIYSARFLGDRAYMVTFQQVDPFFVIDLKDAKNPKILGALKIPGYSNYLHPYDENHVIGFGKEVDASIDADKVHSDDAVYYTAIQGMKVSIFDVTDVSNPKEQWKTVIGDRGTESPLLNDHKALLFDKDRGLLAFPITVTKRPDGSEKSADGNVVFQGAYVYDISLSKGLTLKGTISHEDDPSVYLKGGMYWYGGEKDISRIVRIGDSLLTVSESQVRSNALSTLQQQGKAELQ